MEQFTKEQIREYNDAFCLFDKDGSGDIPSTELRDMLKTIGFNPTDMLLENMTIVIDEDGDGIINFEEFMNLIGNLETDEKKTKQSREAFNAFDFNGKGYIQSHDIKAAIMFVMEKSTSEERQNIVQHFKLDPNRKIYFREFMDMLNPKP